MHPALLIQEILLHIFQYLKSGSNAKGSSLHALLKTCRNFKSAAEIICWSEVDDPRQLIDQLPSYQSNRSATNQLQIVWNVQPTPIFTAFDSQALSKYASLVKTLRVDRPSELTAFATLEQALKIGLAELPVLPSLQHLYWKESGTSNHNLQFLGLFLSSTLMTLKINLGGLNPDSYSLPVFAPVPRKCPNITTLDIQGYGSTAAFMVMVSEIVCACKQLRSLKCDSLTPDAWTHLGQLATLTSIRLLFDPTQLPRTFPTLFFPNSESITLETQSPAVTSSLLLKEARPKIFIFRTTYPDSQFAFGQCLPITTVLANLVNFCDKSLLESFTFYLGGNQPNFDSTHRSGEADLTIQYIDPVLNVINLRELNISVVGKVHLDNTDIQALATSWPHLQTLQLNIEFGWHVTKVTMDGVIALLKSCSKLKKLAMAFDATKLDNLPRRLQDEPWITSLTSLNVLDSPVEDPSAVALIINQMVPKLCELDYWAVPPNLVRPKKLIIEQRERWSLVKSYLRIIALADSKIWHTAQRINSGDTAIPRSSIY
ncbi:hypothetical protein CONPUDRAFT_74704 [Coniophora puteana RWD-64-598 SS2]|uniref:F-box domain-containing protein n=1 Tax=Coniophora puteana (strain RWD-64-598) TaxID=741705 RepID=A0A5M3MKN5_CONPW|nr:uncharacterized protein CONPUDRAFT_74704 [Coniophora puteana RWD-64-598 SS2]EIW79225.1 hypothetical protein CONPUDRAFT_74704 [Coniophora puteana RWD-64-598 SS2]